MRDKTFNVMYFVQNTFNRDKVEYMFYDKSSRKWREDLMLKSEAERLMTSKNTTETVKFGLPVWRVRSRL